MYAEDEQSYIRLDDIGPNSSYPPPLVDRKSDYCSAVDHTSSQVTRKGRGKSAKRPPLAVNHDKLSSLLSSTIPEHDLDGKGKSIDLSQMMGMDDHRESKEMNTEFIKTLVKRVGQH